MPFVKMVPGVVPLTPLERMKADRELKLAMSKSSQAAAAVIALGKEIMGEDAQDELEGIIEKLESLLPTSTEQRIFISYSWLLLSTFKVQCMASTLLLKAGQ